MSNQNTVTYENLYIQGFDILHIKTFELKQEPNEHVTISFMAAIDVKKGAELVSSTQAGDQLEVFYQEEKEKTILFRGFISSVSIMEESQIHYLKVTALSNTVLLDQEKMSRSFQNTQMTIKQIMNEVLQDQKNAGAGYYEAADSSIGGFVLQYKETNWEFIKRLASRRNISLIPAIDSPHASFYYGVSENVGEEKIKVLEYSMEKNMYAYQVDTKNNMKGIAEADYIYYNVKSHVLKNVGEKVLFQGGGYYIRKAYFCMEQGILTASYQLGTKMSFKQPSFYHTKIHGISLLGKVERVDRDKVAVNLAIDGYQSRGSYLFPYSTMSSSPDGSGWYYMPEIGDEIRVYFPDMEEKNAYAVSTSSGYVQPASSLGSTSMADSAKVIAVEGEQKDLMSDPNQKYLRTPFGMEVRLTEDGIEISAADGEAILFLDKDGTILIAGNQNIHISATETLTIESAKDLEMFALESVRIESEGALIELTSDGDTKIMGTYVLEN